MRTTQRERRKLSAFGVEAKSGRPWQIASGHAGATFHPIFTRRKIPEPKPLILWRSQPDSNRCTSLERAMSWASRRWERRGVYPQEPGIIVAHGAL
jgi:hypothetical protein